MAVIYNPKDISDLLQCKESTLRKYSLLLEKYNYNFQKNDRQQRWYTDNDVIVLRKIIALKNNGDMTLEQAVENVVQWTKGSDETLPSTDINPDSQRYNKDIAELKRMIEEQNDQIRKLGEVITKQNEYINSKLEVRDQEFMKGLRELQETKRLIAAEQESEEKKSFWHKLFNK
jgi:DNA-binding transcriptional MerR regulator